MKSRKPSHPSSSRATITRAFEMFIVMAAAGVSVAEAQDPGSDWRVSAGGGVVVASRSLGSGRDRVFPIPVLDARYGERFFATDNPYEGIGVAAHPASLLDVSAALGVDLDTRDPGEDPRVRGLPKVGAAGALRLRVEHSASRWSASLTYSARLAARDQGGATTTGEVAINPLVTDRLLASVGVNGRFADHRWADNFLTVTAEQARATELPARSAPAGLLEAGAFVQAVYRIDDRWTAFARIADSRFTSVAAESPVISHRDDPLVLIFVSRSL